MQTDSELTLFVIRHGETVFNAENRFQGHCDSRLTETGRRQVSSLGARMAKMAFDTLISSDLGRARETATIIAKYTGHPVQTDSRLRERHYGVLEGLTVPEINAGYVDVMDRLEANDPDYVIPEGESHRQHYQRNIDAIKEVKTGKYGSKVALVAHGGVLDSLFRYVASLPLRQPRCFTTTNASLTIITSGSFYRTMRWVIETWCDTAHLEGIGQRFGLG